MGLISNGSTIFDNGSMASGFGGNMVFLSSATASNSASISFTTGIDSTYKEYKFYWFNTIPVSNGQRFSFNLSSDGGSNYNVTKTTTYFTAYNGEAGDGGVLGYYAGNDLAQSTAYQDLLEGVGNVSGQCCAGELTLYNPSSDTFVKHFMSVGNQRRSNPYSEVDYMAGYANTTSAINAINFKFSSGNISDSTILMYGIA
jgi:hypothetical protein